MNLMTYNAMFREIIAENALDGDTFTEAELADAIMPESIRIENSVLGELLPDTNRRTHACSDGEKDVSLLAGESFISKLYLNNTDITDYRVSPDQIPE